MTTFVALLRGINVGGKTMIGMNALRELFESLGFAEVRTLLQSGNVIFQAGGPAAALEERLEAQTRKRFERDVTYLVRSAAEWKTLVAQNPFSQEAKSDPAHLVVMPLKSTPATSSLRTLQGAIVGREYFETIGRELYVVYPDGIGNSKLTNTLIDRKLGTICTGRNWNTVLKIAAALE